MLGASSTKKCPWFHRWECFFGIVTKNDEQKTIPDFSCIHFMRMNGVSRVCEHHRV